MKYINHETIGLILFPQTSQHNNVAQNVGGKILSAGFIDMKDMVCYGESVSLGLHSCVEDTKLLKCYFAMSGG